MQRASDGSDTPDGPDVADGSAVADAPAASSPRALPLEPAALAHAALAVGAYLVFLGTFATTLAFLAGWRAQSTSPTAAALGVDAALLVMFGVQHCVMARPWWKRATARFVPPPLERALYVFASSVALLALVVGWQPIDVTIWDVGVGPARTVMFALLALAGLLVLGASFAFDHFALFGLRQALSPLGWMTPERPDFVERGAYRWVRHPLQASLILISWVTPTMSADHLLYALGMTAYAVLGTALEERDLVSAFGERCRDYQRRVGRFVPRLRGRGEPHRASTTPRLAAHDAAQDDG